MDTAADKKETHRPFIKDCSAFCPKCGSDLYALSGECICKNKNCNWTCDTCKRDAIDEP